MPEIEPVSIGSAPEPEQVMKDGGLGKDEFLHLLTTQMRNQDPTSPMDNTDMIAQLAQFSALEQMNNLNSEFTAARREQGIMDVLSVIGEEVEVKFEDGTSTQGTVQRAAWDKEEGLLLSIGETEYPMQNIVGITKVSQGGQTDGSTVVE